MEHNTDRILWTVLVLTIGVALYIGFRPAANGLLQQGVDKIKTVIVNINDDTNNSSSNNSNSSSSQSSNNTATGANLIKGTSKDLQTVQDASSSTWGGWIYDLTPADFNTLAGNQFTARVFIHNTSSHTVNLVIWTNANGFNVGTGVPAGTDGYSTITAANITSSDTAGDISIRAYNDDAAISGVRYKEFKIEKGSVATPWCPNSADQTQSAI